MAYAVEGQTFYLVRERATRDFLQLRTHEAVKSGSQRYGETLGVPFAIAVSADELRGLCQ